MQAQRISISLFLFFLFSCATDVPRDDSRAIGTQSIATVASGSQERSALMVMSASIRGTTGCRLNYRLYTPAQPIQDQSTLVVVGHGFLRGVEQMDGLARRIASTGLRTASVGFCNSRIWGGRHRENGLDMVALADALDAEHVAYVGFSAGGLSALIAGQRDERTLGVVTLDLVDLNGVGRMAAAALDRPLVGLFGPPSPCNAENNGLAAFAASRQARIHRFPEATHCDFESPTDWLCKRVCGEVPGSLKRREAILATTAKAVTAMTHL